MCSSDLILASVLTLMMIVVTILLIDQILIGETYLMAAAIIFGIISALLIYFYTTDVIIGRLCYYIGNKTISVGRKGKLLYTIDCSNISEAVVTTKSFGEKISYFTFFHKGKRHCVTIDSGNEKPFKILIAHIEHEKRCNTLEYILIFLRESFSIM